MNYMVYYTAGNEIFFTIKMQDSEVSGSDSKERLADIIENYGVSQVERVY